MHRRSSLNVKRFAYSKKKKKKSIAQVGTGTDGGVQPSDIDVQLFTQGKEHIPDDCHRGFIHT